MTKFTKEQRDILIKTAEYMVKRENTSGYSENIRKVAEIALAAMTAGMEQEPVYQACKEAGVWVDIEPDDVASLKANGEQVRALYAAPQLPQPAVVIEGLYKIANHIASCKGGMPEEWQDWAGEIESDIRRISLQPVPDKMTTIVKDEHDYVEGWNACRAAMLQGAEPAAALKPAIFIDGNISPDDADKLAGAISKLNSEHREHPQIIAKSVQVVPEGWDPCSPEWIERNGPCSCAEAPRIAFGSIGNHYHPHIYHNPKNEETP